MQVMLMQWSVDVQIICIFVMENAGWLMIDTMIYRLYMTEATTELS